MNAMNRGSLRAIREMIRDIDNLLIAIANAEGEKECGGNGGAPIEAQRGNNSDSLKRVSSMLEDAMDEIDEIAEREADWEEWLE